MTDGEILPSAGPALRSTNICIVGAGYARLMRFLCILVLALAPSSLPAEDSLPPDRDPQVFVKKGIAFNLKGDFDSAIDSFNKALQLDPQYAPAFENRGEARMKRGELTDAITDFTQTLKLQPKNDAAFLNRGRPGVRARAISTRPSPISTM